MKGKTKRILVYALEALLCFGWTVYALSGWKLPAFLSHTPVLNIVASGMMTLAAGVSVLWILVEELKN